MLSRNISPIHSDRILGIIHNGSRDTHIDILSDGRINTSPHAGQPYDTITLSKFIELVENPQDVLKENAQCIIASSYNEFDARTHEVQRQRGMYNALVGDLDDCNASLSHVDACLAKCLGNDVFRILYTTKSSTPEKQKSRFVIPLAKQLPGDKYSAYQAALFDALQQQGLALDRSLERTAQVFYGPNMGDHYEHLINGSEFLDYDGHPIEIVAKIHLDTMHSESQKSNTAATEGRMSYIGAFRRKHSIDEMLALYGFECSPTHRDLWRHPDQSTVGYGSMRIMRYANGDRWVSLSDTINKFGVGRESGHGRRTGDAFDLYLCFDANREQAKAYAVVCWEEWEAKLLGWNPELETARECLDRFIKHGKELWARVDYIEGIPYSAIAKNEQIESIRQKNQAAIQPETSEDDEWESVPKIDPVAPRERPTPARAMTAAEFYKRFPLKLSPFPITNPQEQVGGFAGALADYIDRASEVSSINGSFMLSLSLLAAVIGPRCATAGTQTRTNMNFAGLDESGMGKSSLLQVVYDLLDNFKPVESDLNATSYLSALRGSEDFHSDSAIVDELLNKKAGGYSVKLCLMDEFGKIMHHALKGSSATHKRKIIDAFTKLFSKSNSIDKGTGAATKEAKRPPIEYPHLNLFGFSTPEVYWGALGSGNLLDGSIARYLAFCLGDTVDQTADRADEEHFRTKLEQFVVWLNALPSVTAANPYRIAWDGNTHDRRIKLRRSMAAAAKFARENSIPGAPAIVRRVAEMTAKIALVLALSRTFWITGHKAEETRITDHDFDIAAAVAFHCAGLAINNIGNHITENDHDANSKEVLRFIEDGKAKGKTMSDIRRKFSKKFPSRALATVLESLVSGEEVVHITEEMDRIRKLGQKGRPSERYIHRAHL